jgi:hypothetical protein
MALFFTAEVVIAMQANHTFISVTNSKLGAHIPCVNLPAITTCIKDAPCARKCYARRGHMALAKVKEKSEINLALWLTEPSMFERDLKIEAFPYRFFRWHSSGDIPDAAYLIMMVRIAHELPGTQFLAFTKKFELVNAYLGEHGNLPDNLTIVFSAWGDWLPDNPFNLPEAHIIFKNMKLPVPQGAAICPRYCGDCVQTGKSCWDMNYGGRIYFHEH